jgi:ribonuclease HI
MAMKKGEKLIEYTAQHFPAISALHSEVRALSSAVQAIKAANLNQVVIFSDCRQLSDAIGANEPPTNLDWHFYSEVFQIWLFVREL